MSLELFTAGKLLEMALSAIVGNAASGGVNLLWQQIRTRLLKNKPVIEAEIVKLEQNPTQENLKSLKAFLQDEIDKDNKFAEEISKLAREIATQNSGHTIEIKNNEFKDNAISIGKAEAETQNIGGKHYHFPKN
jgi:phenylalanyl-tRNA synthetase alpha subunit